MYNIIDKQVMGVPMASLVGVQKYHLTRSVRKFGEEECQRLLDLVVDFVTPTTQARPYEIAKHLTLFVEGRWLGEVETYLVFDEHVACLVDANAFDHPMGWIAPDTYTVIRIDASNEDGWSFITFTWVNGEEPTGEQAARWARGIHHVNRWK